MTLLALLLGCARDDTPSPAADEPILPYDPLAYVDPMIGTGGPGAQVTGLNPGATAPYGLSFAGPDTRSSAFGAIGFYHFGGYHYDDDLVDGFSHTHSHGMGVNDYGAALVMPRARWSDAWTEDETRAAPFTHDREWASAGYYAVDLQDDGTKAEIAASTRGAVHRYTFAPGAEPVVVFDLGHTLGDVTIEDATWAWNGAEVVGFQRLVGAYSGRYGGLLTHFVATFDPPPVGSGAWDNPAAPVEGAVAGTGGGWVAFPAGTTEVELRLALSYVDHDGARANLAELDGSFEDVLAATEAAWRAELETVRVRGGTEAERRTFHTAQYHATIMPDRFDDLDGRYRGIDGEIHTTDVPYYTDFSLWDTFRTLHPWYALTRPDRQRELVASLVQMTVDGGTVPRWPLGHGYTGGMVGTPADQVFAETWLKGIDGWDVDTALEASVTHAFEAVNDGRDGIDSYTRLGFVSFEDEGQPASQTLEYAWSDHALALWAADRGHPDAEALAEQSGNWANTWNADVAFFQGRHEDGSFDDDFSALAWADDYVEGNAWHYLWYVPWDVPGMIALQHGGDADAFLSRLSDYWDDVYAEPDDAFPDDWYWHGNEPVLHYAALGALAGDHALTAESTRYLMATRYDDTPLGLDGNDDGGTLSAWYLWWAIGLYPIAGTPTYVLGSPIFDRVEIDRPDGTLVIRAPGTSAEVMHVRSVTVDGEAVEGWTIEHAELVGREVVFEMETAVSR